ncbi:hypothetical protein BC831DRAFT_481332 [Entophlyctis helioformis]|nr:hypothetical protein BC831DRAFT_481332 [Entophlyctis helioformis]
MSGTSSFASAATATANGAESSASPAAAGAPLSSSSSASLPAAASDESSEYKRGMQAGQQVAMDAMRTLVDGIRSALSDIKRLTMFAVSIEQHSKSAHDPVARAKMDAVALDFDAARQTGLKLVDSLVALPAHIRTLEAADAGASYRLGYAQGVLRIGDQSIKFANSMRSKILSAPVPGQASMAAVAHRRTASAASASPPAPASVPAPSTGPSAASAAFSHADAGSLNASATPITSEHTASTVSSHSITTGGHTPTPAHHPSSPFALSRRTSHSHADAGAIASIASTGQAGTASFSLSFDDGFDANDQYHDMDLDLTTDALDDTSNSSHIQQPQSQSQSQSQFSVDGLTSGVQRVLDVSGGRRQGRDEVISRGTRVHLRECAYSTICI